MAQVVKSDRFEPHPVSGEVEIDWDGEVKKAYRRLDEETLQCLVTLVDRGLDVKLIWCVGDAEGGGDGWRIGEVGVIDSAQDGAWGNDSIATAEDAFESKAHPLWHAAPVSERRATNATSGSGSSWQVVEPAAGEDDDDDYWAQYDNTPARTPGPHPSPGPQAAAGLLGRQPMSEEDAYYAQYEDVQPAMDSHDPDEAAQNGEVESTLGHSDIAQGLRRDLMSHQGFSRQINAESGVQSMDPAAQHVDALEVERGRDIRSNGNADLISPRPSSSSSSHGSNAVARLERTAALQGSSEIGVKQHLATSVKSLYRLAKAAGIERSEFERLVKTELDLLSVGDDD